MQPAPVVVDDRAEPVFGENFLETLEYLHIIAQKILSGQMKAERRSKQKGVSVEFVDHRPYSPGDDFRFIDWGVFFRTEQLFLKLFEEEEDLHIYLLLDCSKSMDFGMPYKFHYARRLAAAIGYLGLASLDRVFIIPFTDSVPKSAAETLRLRGKGKVFRMLDFLESRETAGPTALQPALRGFGASKRKLGDVRLLDAESDRYRDVTLTESLLRKYRTTFEEHCIGIERFCRSKEIGYIRCRTDVPFQDAVVHMLRRGKLFQ